MSESWNQVGSPQSYGQSGGAAGGWGTPGQGSAPSNAWAASSQAGPSVAGWAPPAGAGPAQYGPSPYQQPFAGPYGQPQYGAPQASAHFAPGPPPVPQRGWAPTNAPPPMWPGYQGAGPGNYPPPAPPRPKGRGGILIALILLLGSSLVAGMLVFGGREFTRQLDVFPLPVPGAYQNDDYEAPAPDLHPPELVFPASEAQAKQLLEENPLYAQKIPRPIRCEISTVDPTKDKTDALQTHADQVTACLMRQWAGVLEAAGFVAVRPSVTLYDSPTNTACGSIESQNAVYCGRDQQVYFATDLVDVLPPKVAKSRLMVDIVLAHEFGHAIQGRTGILASANVVFDGASVAEVMTAKRRSELQADCLAGLYIGSLVKSMAITPEELKTVTDLFASGGDDSDGKPTSERSRGHGSSANRAHWAKVGLDANPAVVGVCNTWKAPADLVS